MADVVDTAVAAGAFSTPVKAAPAAGPLETLNGPGPFARLPAGTLDAALADRAWLIGDATVVTAGVEASNGVIHAIDTVLLPA